MRQPRINCKLAAALLRLMRPHHWVKNLLLLVPLLTSHRFNDALALANELRAIVAMCLISSAVYIVNDLLDLHSDRMHRTKRFRPLASGAVSPRAAMMLASVLTLSAGLLAGSMPSSFSHWLMAYCAIAIAYSLWLKRRAVIDVLALAALYTVRVLLGAAAIAVPLSDWLLLFALTLFMGLALLKRYVEVDDAVRAVADVGPGRGYRLSDRRTIGRFGVASGCLATLVLVFYANSAAVAINYSVPWLLWALAPLLAFWLGRAWFAAFRSKMHDDPIVYALRDPASYVVVMAMVGVTWFAL
jgi:4-hydroxybenzoate polyprenyltransferase